MTIGTALIIITAAALISIYRLWPLIWGTASLLVLAWIALVPMDLQRFFF